METSDNAPNITSLQRLNMKYLNNISYKVLSDFSIATIWQRQSHRNSRSEVFCKNVFLEILQNSQENTCTRVSILIKLQAWGLQVY